jgi:hypothetical protein
MQFIARLLSVSKLSEVPGEVMPFVQFQANLKKVELKGNEEVAVLQIEGTDCYHPVILKGAKLSAIEKELAEIDAELSKETRDKLKKVLK